MMQIVFLLASLCIVQVVNAGPVEKCKKVVDIALVVDESGSIGASNFVKVKSFLQSTVSRFSVTPFGAHFGIVKYSTIPRLVFQLDKYTDIKELQQGIRSMQYIGGSTFTGLALQYTRQNMFGQRADRKDVPNVLVLFSDGKSHDHPTAVSETKQMKKEGIVVLCVAIGNGAVLIQQLKQLASKPEYVYQSAIDALDTIEDKLVKRMCEVVDPCQNHPCQNGGKCLQDGDSYKCVCGPNYEGKKCEHKKWCPGSPAKFTKRGCYKMPPQKAKDQLLFNRKNDIEWTDKWDQFIEKLVCDCGKKAKELGFNYFCIEFYGECWGYTYKQLDIPEKTAGPGKCWGKRPNYNQCNHELEKPICVGVASHGYVYELK